MTNDTGEEKELLWGSNLSEQAVLAVPLYVSSEADDLKPTLLHSCKIAGETAVRNAVLEDRSPKELDIISALRL